MFCFVGFGCGLAGSFGLLLRLCLACGRLGEAVAKLDKYLDDAYLSGIPQVRIVHGKGTGALRNGVAAYLKGISYVKSFRLGEQGEGDAGVTIVEFK